MKRKNLLFLIFPLLIVVVFVILWEFFLRRVDYVSLSGKTEEIINNYLLSRGLKDKNILRVYREEKKIKGVPLVEVNKDVLLPQGSSLEDYKNQLTKLLKKSGIRVYRAQIEGNRLYLESGFRDKILSRFTFILSPVGKIAIVIDDLGYNRKQLDNFLELGVPLTFAILPGEAYSRSLAEELVKKNQEIVMHLPLEPKNRRENPGKHALWLRMSSKEILEKFKKNLSTVPGVIGVSNHMGSKFTENRPKMEFLLLEIKRENLFFFDSYTSRKSVVPELASKLNLPHLQNQVFLDVKTEEIEIKKKFEELLSLAKKNGQAIAIGHIHSANTAKVMASLIPRFEHEGIVFVTLSQLMK